MKANSYIIKAQHFSSLAETELNFLYRPLFSSLAFSIYHLFFSLASFDKDYPRDSLWQFLSCTKEEGLQALTQLEAVGLLKTYVVEGETKSTYYYEVQPPLSATQFFLDDILSFLLFHQLGEVAFDQLKAYFLSSPLPEAKMEITKNFNEVYDFSEQQFQLAQPHLYTDSKACARKIFQAQAEEKQWWEELLSLLSREMIDIEDLKQKEEPILFLHRSFHFSDLEWIQLLEASAEPMDGQVDLKKLQNYVMKAQQLKQRPKEEPALKKWQTEDPKLQKICAIAEKLAPIDFLGKIKSQQQGVIISSERFAILETGENHTVPSAVINLVVYYLLVIEKNLELPRNRFEKMINRLGRRKDFDLIAIWNDLPHLLETKETLKGQIKSQYQASAKKQIIRPEWEETSEEQRQKRRQELDSEQKEKLLARLEQFTKQGKEK